ncbi:MAG: TrkH family potassium uptake protein [Anaerolineales bacterium]|nr:TrkH family potassium uptake protein [Anaerolineales bacterium]
MRIKVVLNYLGMLLAMVGLFMVIPLIWSIYYNETDTNAFLISVAITAGSGAVLWYFTRIKSAMPTLREALLLVSLAWIIVSVYSAIPYMLAGTFDNFIDAYFESMSGFTTTGSSVLTTIEAEPHGILVWRSLTQWLGGMGIVMFFVAILPQLGVGAAFMVSAEAGPGPEAVQLTERIRRSARVLLIIYVGMSFLEVAALSIAGLSFFDSITVTFSTMPTGGFSARTASIAAFDSVAVDGIVTFFMAAAGINFALYYLLLWKRSLKSFINNRELRLYVTIILAASIIIALDLIINSSYGAASAFRQSIFQTVSIQTTTGFVTADYDIWPTLSRGILLTLMMIGACAGSTGGAIKVIRVLIVERYIHRQITSFHSPRAVMPIKLAGRPVSERWVMRALGFVTLYVLVMIVFSLILSAADPSLDLESSFAAVIANLGNVGPGLSAVGPSLNYAAVSPFGKVLLSLSMLLGRLEFWPVLALTTPSFWNWR